eukprot:1160614-Pelagomonas_calceolata.AAC.6
MESGVAEAAAAAAAAAWTLYSRASNEMRASYVLLVYRLNDLVGSDVGFHVGKNFLDSFPDRVYISQLIPMMNQLKRLGEKTGKGFYKVRRYVCCRGEDSESMIVPLQEDGLLQGGGERRPARAFAWWAHRF